MSQQKTNRRQDLEELFRVTGIHRSSLVRDTVNNVLRRGHVTLRSKLNGETVLHESVADNNISATRTLLEMGADPNIKNDDDVPVLTYAIGRSRSNTRMVQLLLEYGARPEAVSETMRSGVGNPMGIFYNPDIFALLNPTQTVEKRELERMKIVINNHMNNAADQARLRPDSFTKQALLESIRSRKIPYQGLKTKQDMIDALQAHKRKIIRQKRGQHKQQEKRQQRVDAFNNPIVDPVLGNDGVIYDRNSVRQWLAIPRSRPVIVGGSIPLTGYSQIDKK
jgi:ankyrin repeat protein